jgi:hypothetical protein
LVNEGIKRADVVAVLRSPKARKSMADAVLEGRPPATAVSRDLAEIFGFSRTSPAGAIAMLSDMIRRAMDGEDLEPASAPVACPDDPVFAEAHLFVPRAPLFETEPDTESRARTFGYRG